ncbi:MAG: diguanylate cyclase [Pseudoxanthomonas sp.]
MYSDQGKVRRLNFSKRMHPLRAAGLALGALCVGVSLYEDGVVAPWLWAALGFSGLLWPHVAYLLARNSTASVRAEYRNLLIDAAQGGFWIAAMGFDTLPSVLLAIILMMNQIIVGGRRFAAKSLALLGAICLLTSAALGFRFDPVTSYPTLLACLPMLVVLPLVIGGSSRSLGQKTLQQKKLLEKTSRFDAATGLLNRQQWLFAARTEFDRFLRAGRPAVLMMIDIDSFKQINDGYGHTVGDLVIEEFARLMKACLRDIDSGGRYGGDEFCVIMPETRWEEAIVAAERLRRQVASYEFPQPGLHCTISVGLAEINPTIASVNDWVVVADAALYAAKARGRDCIEVARLPPLLQVG